MTEISYPPTRRTDQLDSYHGTPVADPYRWLEESESAERDAWVQEQNAVTAEFMSRLPVREALRTRFNQLLNYPRVYDLAWRRPLLLLKMNNGLDSHLVLCSRTEPEGTVDVLVDPRRLALDGTLALRSFSLSGDGRFLVYALSERGSEWEEYRIRDMTTSCDLPDRVRWIKASTIAWRGAGFYYSRYPIPASQSSALTAVNRGHQVWYHRVGTPQAADQLIYENPADGDRIHMIQNTPDGLLSILRITNHRAGHPGTAIWLVEGPPEDREFRPVVTTFDDAFRVVDSANGQLMILTTRGAPNRRLVLVDPQHPTEAHWHELIGEQPQPLDDVVPCGEKLLVTYRHDAAQRLYVFDRSGCLEREVPLPGIGLLRVVPGLRDDTEAFLTFTTFTRPSSVMRYHIAEGRTSIVLRPSPQYDVASYQTTQVFYPAKDGTPIPMFVVHRRDLKLDGGSPALLHGYGGYGACMGPAFDPFVPALLERGVVYAVPCLRGGGEYGEAWHRAGWREHKQTVFDDCIAAAEWLQREGYTSRDRCALIGASNGGLLVGAVLTQRPDLFRVAVPCAGILDMLRYHLFTTASGSIAEFGSSDDAALFPVLLSYSPLHNVRENVSYPATLVATYALDDCVVPAHSFKFIAALQQLGARTAPYLLRVEADSGHGAVNLTKAIEERADMYAFLLAHLSGTVEPIITDRPPARPPSRSAVLPRPRGDTTAATADGEARFPSDRWHRTSGHSS